MESISGGGTRWRKPYEIVRLIYSWCLQIEEEREKWKNGKGLRRRRKIQPESLDSGLWTLDSGISLVNKYDVFLVQSWGLWFG